MTDGKGKCKVGCPKVERKVFTAEVVIRSHGTRPLPDFGLGEGVLTKTEVAFKDERGRGFDSPLFAMRMVELGESLTKDAVEVRWTEKKTRRGREVHTS